MKISTDFDYINESLSLLFLIGSQEGLEQKIKKNIAKFHVDETKFYASQKQTIKLLLQIEKEMTEKLGNQWEEFLFYFGPIPSVEFSDSLGRILLLWEEFHRKSFASLQDYENYLLTMEEDAFRKSFAFTLQGIFDTIRDSSQYESLTSDEDILSYILDLELPLAYKLRLEDFYLNHGKHQKKALVFIKKAIQLLQRHQASLQKLLTHFRDYWSAQVPDGDFTAYMINLSGNSLALPNNELEDLVLPCFFYPTTMGACISLNDKGLPEGAYCYPVGILYCDAFPLSFSQQPDTANLSQEECLNLLKLICEPTRFQILSDISKEPAFGNELAKRLDLTTATVSHHMGLLIQEKLATLREEGVRIYYESNPRTIQMCLDKVRTDFDLIP